MSSTKTPSWWPRVIDDNRIADLRKMYPETTDGMSNEVVLSYYEEGKPKGGFTTLWDNVGEAYEDYEKLATAFLRLVKETGKSPSDFD
jgi:hypothetical protein